MRKGASAFVIRELRGYSPDLIGRVMTVLHVGSMFGAIFWGLVADRLGPRARAAGFALSAVFIGRYLNVPPSPFLYAVAGFCYGLCLVCSGV